MNELIPDRIRQNCLDVVKTLRPLFKRCYEKEGYNQETFLRLLLNVANQATEDADWNFDRVYSLLEEAIERAHSSKAIQALYKLESGSREGHYWNTSLPRISELLGELEREVEDERHKSSD